MFHLIAYVQRISTVNTALTKLRLYSAMLQIQMQPVVAHGPLSAIAALPIRTTTYQCQSIVRNRVHYAL